MPAADPALSWWSTIQAWCVLLLRCGVSVSQDTLPLLSGIKVGFVIGFTTLLTQYMYKAGSKFIKLYSIMLSSTVFGILTFKGNPNNK